MLTKTPQDELLCNSMEASAREAGLVYCSDQEPGFTRRKSGRRFSYHDRDGKLLRDAVVLHRIRELAIPPAWTGVWIAPRMNCHVQATGRDVRGRKQYRYHPDWTACRDDAKFSTLLEFAHALPKIRRRIDADLRGKGLTRDKVLGTVVWLLDNAMIRVGNTAYMRENNSFGLTTLRDKHVKVAGSSMRFSFVGKSGKDWSLKVTDRRIARIVKGAQGIPGQHLFQYIGDDGDRRAVGSQDVNAYLRETAGQVFTSKHFRTWDATVRAAVILAHMDHPDTKGGAAKVLNAAIDEVASTLGNTRSVCRKCYIDPAVISAWNEGRLADELSAQRSRIRRPPAGLDREEAVVLRWLELERRKAPHG